MTYKVTFRNTLTNKSEETFWLDGESAVAHAITHALARLNVMLNTTAESVVNHLANIGAFATEYALSNGKHGYYFYSIDEASDNEACMIN